ncbi:unnamed protein product [Protopolystoma xenopodis]|uniref:Uncharacterized protein n=1 Tax=Protopolystoma xenopodis TaxID=117903 RepID=A0A3S5C6E1_9PLAT|nr:unnamed protein product [Protopolystoma xenopodis]
MDIVGPLPSSNENCYLLTNTDGQKPPQFWTCRQIQLAKLSLRTSFPGLERRQPSQPTEAGSSNLTFSTDYLNY